MSRIKVNVSAATRCIRVAEEVRGVAELTDAKGEVEASWYRTYGAQVLEDAPLSLVPPLTTLADALKQG